MITAYPDGALLDWARRVGLTRWAFANADGRTDRQDDRVPGPPAKLRSGFVVVSESARGRAGAAAVAIARAAEGRGFAVDVTTIDDANKSTIENSDVLVAGCWTPGRAPFGDAPMRRMTAWVDSLPRLDGKPVGVYCTYRFFPHTFADVATRTAEAELCLAAHFERKGAALAAKKAIHFGSIDTDAADLLGRVLQYVA